MPTLPLSLLGADAGLWLLLPLEVYVPGHPRACPSMADGLVSRQQE
jgi:hypothetical protein